MSALLQSRIPPIFQFARNKPLGRIDGLVTAGGERSLIIGFLEFPAHGVPDILIDLRGLVGGADGGLDGML
jgi:hypothetical protein